MEHVGYPTEKLIMVDNEPENKKNFTIKMG